MVGKGRSKSRRGGLGVVVGKGRSRRSRDSSR